MAKVITSRHSEHLAAIELLLAVKDRPGTVWLDTSGSQANQGMSLTGYDPVGEIRLQNDTLIMRNGQETIRRRATIFDALAALDLAAVAGKCAIGFIAYEAMLPFIGQSEPIHSSLPKLHFYLYDTVLKYTGRLDLDDYPAFPEQVNGRYAVTSSLPRSEYYARVERVKEYIREGDIYQANFTCRFTVDSDEQPFSVYRRLRQASPAPYSAYINFGEYQVLSSSPERMLYRDGEHLTTSPIKGTIHRGNCGWEDMQNEKLLLNSQKDLAEHLMIVDLERNDLGKIAELGSVKVDELFRPERYASVIHLVSDVSAQISPELPMSAVFAALLPGGSITGAPKRRAIEIIRELETVPRGVYTGCIGYIQGKKADFNIAIRTMVCENGKYYIHAGGGIVADSDQEAEYREMLLKAERMFEALGIAQKDMPCLSG